MIGMKTPLCLKSARLVLFFLLQYCRAVIGADVYPPPFGGRGDASRPDRCWRANEGEEIP